MRTFIAVEVTNREVIDAITTFQKELPIKARPVKTQNMHFTLLFLGDITEVQKEDIQNSLERVYFEPFEIKFSGVGAFPKSKSPNVVWVGVEPQTAIMLVRLANIVQDILAPLGFESDKPFRPHMTVFRIKNKIGNITNELKKYQNNTFGTQVVKEIKFKQSILTPAGPKYSDLQVVKAR
jgi:2'-5' RNA ligase